MISMVFKVRVIGCSCSCIRIFLSAVILLSTLQYIISLTLVTDWQESVDLSDCFMFNDRHLLDMYSIILTAWGGWFQDKHNNNSTEQLEWRLSDWCPQCKWNYLLFKLTTAYEKVSPHLKPIDLWSALIIDINCVTDYFQECGQVTIIVQPHLGESDVDHDLLLWALSWILDIFKRLKTFLFVISDTQ